MSHIHQDLSCSLCSMPFLFLPEEEAIEGLVIEALTSNGIVWCSDCVTSEESFLSEWGIPFTPGAISVWATTDALLLSSHTKKRRKELEEKWAHESEKITEPTLEAAPISEELCSWEYWGTPCSNSNCKCKKNDASKSSQRIDSYNKSYAKTNPFGYTYEELSRG